MTTGNYGIFRDGNTSLKIYCGSTSKPTGWSEYWNCYKTTTNPSSYNLSVYWGYTREQFNALN